MTASPLHTDSHDAPRGFLEVLALLPHSARRRRAGHNVLVSHLRHAGSPDQDHANDRYDQWRLPKLGAWPLHGHSHSITHRRDHGIHVDLNACNLTPFSIDTNAQILDEPN
jgi:calcineurin-like phosphoesterase family protein